MKKITLALATMALLLFINNKTLAQDFTVAIGTTDKCAGYIQPLKAGASIQFQIKVTNNRTDTCTVSIDKGPMGITSSWVTIDNNSQVLFPQQSATFLLTVNVPSNTQEGTYVMFLYFNAYDKANLNHPFNYNAQTVIVDNTPPSVPSFLVSPTSTKVSVSSCSSFDAMSSIYTNYNSSSGIAGIKSYTITLENPDNSVKGTQTINATSGNSYTFENVSPDTNYKVKVTATDLAGNASSKEIAATTAPAPPTLSSSTKSFCHITLNWSVSGGATSYELFNSTASQPVLLTTTTDTSFVVAGLTSGTNNKFFVKAFNSSGLGSDAGNILSDSTLSVPAPTIIGPTSICSAGASFTVTNLPAECSLEWNHGAGLTLFSSSGNSATFKATGDSVSWIEATIDSGCGTASKTINVDAGTPKPGPIRIEFNAPPKRFTAIINGMVSAISYNWYLDGVLIYNTTSTAVIFQRQLNNCGHVYYVDVAMVNGCGTSLISHAEVSEPPCYNSYIVYPNPVSTEINITQNTNLSVSTGIENYEPKVIKSIKIIDNNGFTFISKKFDKAAKEASINISGLKVGSYQIIINEGEGQESHSFIKY